MNFFYKQNIVLMVRALYFCMDGHWSELGKTYDISPSQQHILFILCTNEKTLTPSEISEIGCWHVSTVTRLIKPLKERGYITVEKDPERSKYKKVTITSTGEDLFDQIITTVLNKDSFPFDMNHLSEQELDVFLQCGQKILDANKGTHLREKIFNAKLADVDYL